MNPTTPTAVDARAGAVMSLLCLVWALQQVSLKAVADAASPLLMVALRSGIALVMLALLMRWRGETPQRQHFGPGLVAGALFGLEYLLVARALQLAPASHVVIFLYTAPLFAALGLHLRLPAERLAPPQWAGIALAFAGTAWAFAGSAGGATLQGDLLALAAGAAWGATTVTLRCSRLATAPATETLLYQLLGAFVLLLPVAALDSQAPPTFTPRVLAHLGFQAVVVSFASFLAWCWLLRRYLASQLGAFAFLTPLFGVLLGMALLDERPEAGFGAGCLGVLAGIALVSGIGPARRRHAVMRTPAP